MDRAVKNDSDKLARPELLDPSFILGVSRVLKFGADKYGADNWRSGDDEFSERVYGALIRHILAWRSGEELDPETRENHLYHAACNLYFLLGLNKGDK